MKHFEEMFRIMSYDKSMSQPKISQQKLEELFKIVDFKPNDTLQKEMTNYFSKKKEGEKEITFEEFRKLFSLKENTELPKIKVKNAFRMLSKEYGDKDGLIHRSRIKDLLEEIGVDAVEAAALVGQLEAEFRPDGYLDFETYIDKQYQ